MTNSEHDRRRLDRITAEDYLAGMDERSAAEVRKMRDECRDEESHLSYTRRLLQGRVDIARAEAARRQGGYSGDLVDALPRILADAPSRRTTADRPAAARSSPVFAPEGVRRQEDHLLDDGILGQVPDMSDDELAELTEQLEADERRISDLRRLVLDRLDTLQDELIRRYQKGQVPVEDIVAAATRPRPEPDAT